MRSTKDVIENQDSPNARSVDRTFNVFGVLLNFLVTPAETGHEVSLFKGILPPGVVIPLHSHAEPEVFYVLEGSLEVYREGGQPQGWSTAQPGGVLAIPGNVKHALRNTSSTPTAVLLVTQDELYNFFRSIAKPFGAGQMPAPPSPEDMQQLFAAAAKYHYWMGSPEENATIGISLG
jgi:quercetin dioxygenase-like cupin family protein